MTAPQPGSVLWAWIDPTTGREQAGRRPVVVISSAAYLDVVTTLVIAVPVTTTDRGWPHHVPLTGAVGLAGFAMTEQPRTVSRERLGDVLGAVDDACLHRIRTWVGDFLDLA